MPLPSAILGLLKVILYYIILLSLISSFCITDAAGTSMSAMQTQETCGVWGLLIKVMAQRQLMSAPSYLA